jgi:hypothetical protein
MPSLAETNPWLQDPEMRRWLNESSAHESSVFEGATGLPQPSYPGDSASKRRRIALEKKAASDE